MEDRLTRVEGRLSSLDVRLGAIEARMATKDDIIMLQRFMLQLLLTLILPIYAVLIVFLIFVYNAKP